MPPHTLTDHDVQSPERAISPIDTARALRPPRARSADLPRQAVRGWLIVVATLVFAMVVVGGATRLTGSGLSITEWRPIMGAIPPLTSADWQDAFDKYRQILQYKLINKGMSLDAFKVIFWWEWGHRFLGRIIGLVFAVPFALFWLKGWLPRAQLPKLLSLFALGGLQGFIGWYMVQSGLVDRTDVSQYRLALHLSIAALIFAGLLWLVFDVSPAQKNRVRLHTLRPGTATTAKVLLVLLFGQIALGALVAGMKAGLAHNTWPLMDGRMVPAGLFAMSPWWLNLFENALTVQFDHRLLAYVIAAVGLWHAVRCWRAADDERVQHSAALLALAIIAQIGIGIWTLLAMVPLWLGLAHQAAAFILLGVTVWHVHAITRS